MIEVVQSIKRQLGWNERKKKKVISEKEKKKNLQSLEKKKEVTEPKEREERKIFF